MRLLILGDSGEQHLQIPKDATEAWAIHPGGSEVLELVLSAGVSTTLVSRHPECVADDVLDQVVNVIQSDDPQGYLLQQARTSDVALLSWDDSDEHYRLLQELTSRGVAVLDLADNCRQLVIQAPVDEVLRSMTEAITEQVLRTVRAEIKEKFDERVRGRRFRSGAARE